MVSNSFHFLSLSKFFNKYVCSFDDAGLLKEKVFWSEVMTSKFLSKMSPTKFYHVTQIIL